MKSLKRLLSLLLAVSALCILFAFQASALTTTCPTCNGSHLGYFRLGDVGIGFTEYHHDVYCNDCNYTVFEEACEICDCNNASGHLCECGQFMQEHSFTDWIYNGQSYYRYCVVCGYYDN